MLCKYIYTYVGRLDDYDDNNNNVVVEEENKKGEVGVVPVTILSGFLGSGKTTLIQYILSSPDHGKRIAVIENEFAGDDYNDGRPLEIESMIARDYINNNDNSNNNDNLMDLIELPNGCICCTVKDSLVTTLEALLDATTNNNNNNNNPQKEQKELDYIIIEASGMANPGPIASVFWLDEALESRLALNGIVTLIDALHIHQQLETTSSSSSLNTTNNSHGGIGGGDEAAQQIAFADRILLNKLDLIPEPTKDEYLQHLTSRIRSINSIAPIQMTTFSKIPDLDWIFQAAQSSSIHTTTTTTTTTTTVDCHPISSPTNHNNATDVCTDIACILCPSSSQNSNNNPTLPLVCMPCNDNDNTDSSISSSNSSRKKEKMKAEEDDHKHTNTITSITLMEYASVSLPKINTWLATICWPDQDKDDAILTAQLKQLEQSNQITSTKIQQEQHQQAMKRMQIFRIKGILSIVKNENNDDIDIDLDLDQQQHHDNDKKDVQLLLEPRRYIVQAVHDIWDVYPSQNQTLLWNDDTEKRCCKMVIIGRCLDRKALTQGFHSCFIHSS